MCNEGERTSAVLLRQVGEAPDVAQPHSVAHGRQQERELTVPGLSLLLTLLRLEDRLTLARPHHLGVQPRRRRLQHRLLHAQRKQPSDQANTM